MPDELEIQPGRPRGGNTGKLYRPGQEPPIRPYESPHEVQKEITPMEIKARKRIAVLYQCPECNAQTFQNCLTATKKNLERRPRCSSSSCGLKYGFGEEPEMQVKERRYFTMFAEEYSLNGTMRAGTLGEIGGRFKVCQIVQPNLRAFRSWLEKRRAELAEENRKYEAEWARRRAEADARRENETLDEAPF